ncbi:MAG: dihydroorotase, partial [Firmicutes bacterium]|nr:dihydroorotase [Bacillota bacterium]
PNRRFGIPESDDCTVFDLESSYRIDPKDFISMGKSTPFKDWEVYGKCMLTVCGGKTAYIDKDLKEEEWNRFC